MPDDPPRHAPIQLSIHRSGTSVLQSPINIKCWQLQTPTVDQARPACCPRCRTPSCPVGGAIKLHGHGTRERQVRGPRSPEQAPEMVVVQARRYLCTSCGAVVIVVPREVLARRLYSASAIGFALALWGLVLATAAEVRKKISPAKFVGDAAVTGWVTLQRWARAVARKALFSTLPHAEAEATLRQVAALAAAALAASADATTRELPMDPRAFLGAAHAA